MRVNGGFDNQGGCFVPAANCSLNQAGIPDPPQVIDHGDPVQVQGRSGLPLIHHPGEVGNLGLRFCPDQPRDAETGPLGGPILLC